MAHHHERPLQCHRRVRPVFLKEETATMKRSTQLRNVAAIFLAGLLALVTASTIVAEQESSCLTCHLCEAMLIKNRGVTIPMVSAMQSGAG
jgi:hypothetical protein